MRILLRRFGAALPDTVTASVFLTLWFAPLRFGPRGVGNAMLVMIVEFILIHSTIMVPVALVVLSERFGGPRKTLLATGVLIAVYLFFLAALSAGFHAWWPCLAFSWLLLAKFGAQVPGMQTAQTEEIDEGKVWVLSLLAYFGGMFAFTLLPLPQLGFATLDNSALELPSRSTGIWIREPFRVLAFGTFYFYFLAWTKWRLAGLRKTPPARPPGRPNPA